MIRLIREIASALVILALTWTVHPVVAVAVQPDWHHSLSLGRALAQAQHKPLFIVFTGLDWCANCITLDQQVFHSSSFVEASRDQFIFVELDKNTLGDCEDDTAREAEIEALNQQFFIGGYPTVVLADSEAKPYAYFVGYDDATGAETYLARVNAAGQAYARFLAASPAVDGPATESELEPQAGALAELAESIEFERGEEDPLIEFYGQTLDRIFRVLPESNAARQALAQRHELHLEAKRLAREWQPIEQQLEGFHVASDWNAALAYIDDILPTAKSQELRLKLLWRRLSLLELAKKFDEERLLAISMRSEPAIEPYLLVTLGVRECFSLKHMGRLDDAIARFDERIAMAERAEDREDHSRNLFWKTALLSDTDRGDEAIAAARAAMDRAVPGSFDWSANSFWLARGLRKLGRYREAVDVSVEQLRVTQDPDSALDVARGFCDLDDPRSAEQYLDRARELIADFRKSPRRSERNAFTRIRSEIDELSEQFQKR